MTNVGLSVVKGVANPVTPAVLPDTNSLGLLFRRKRGVPNKAHIYGSVTEDKELFGGSESGLYAPEVVKNLFDNAGDAPVKLHGVRVVAEDAAPATATVADATSGFSIALKSGYKGEEDPGDWLNGYTAEVGVEPASNTGVENPFYFKLSNADGEVVEYLDSASWAGLVSLIGASKYVMITGTPTANASSPDNETSISAVTSETYSLTSSRQMFLTVPSNSDLSTLLRAGRKVFYNDGATSTLIGTIASFTVSGASGTEIYASIQFQSGDYAGQPSGEPLDSSALRIGVANSDTAVFAGGSDGTASDADFFGALDVLNPYYLKAVSLVDVMSLQSTSTAQSWAKQNNTLIVGVLPFGATDQVKISYKTLLRNQTEPALALYDLWVKAYSESADDQVWIPGVGAVLGAGYIRVPARSNDQITTPPAGVGSAIEGITDVSPKNLSQLEINTHVQDWGINVVRSQEGLGNYIASSRTVSSNPLYHSIHTILQANYYRKVLKDSLAWAEQQPITVQFDTRVVGFLNAFFSAEYENGALENSISFNDACLIISGSAINPPSQDRKIRNFEVQYIPVEASESVVIRLNRNDGSLIVN